MPEEELQLEDTGNPSMPSGDVDLSDDDLAASLGFMTTLTERTMAPPEEETDLEEDTEEAPDKPENRDAEQDTDIKELEDRIAMLENQVQSETTLNDIPTRDTGLEA